MRICASNIWQSSIGCEVNIDLEAKLCIVGGSSVDLNSLTGMDQQKVNGKNDGSGMVTAEIPTPLACPKGGYGRTDYRRVNSLNEQQANANGVSANLLHRIPGYDVVINVRVRNQHAFKPLVAGGTSRSWPIPCIRH